MANALRIAAPLIISGFLICGPVQALEFSVSNPTGNNRFISLSGTINVGDAAILRGLLEEVDQQNVIVLNSDGGSVTEALKIGRDIRRGGAGTFVPNGAKCLSACILAFVGGETKVVSKDGALGSHQFYWPAGQAPSGSDATYLSQKLTANVLRHFLALGIDPEALTLIMDTPPDEMLVFTPEMLKRFNLVGKASAPGRTVNSPDGEKRVGCPFPETYINSDPLNLYPACRR